MAINEIKIFVDMDGVLSDFQKAVKKLGPKAVQGLGDEATQEQKQTMYDAIEEAREPFWAEMSWTERGKELWKMLKPYKPIILSSPGKFLYAPAGKNTWMNKNLPGIQYFLEEDKWHYVERNTVLIDDMEKNVRDWDAAGGFGILYEGDPEAVKARIEDIMKKEMLYKQSKVLFEIDQDSIVKSGDNEYMYCCTTPPHPFGMKLKDRNKKYIYLHRALMELQLGRFLKDGEEVHHKDENRKNNKPGNLELVEFKGHQKDHSHKTKFWNRSPRNKPGREAAQRVVSKYSQSPLRLEKVAMGYVSVKCGRTVLKSVGEFTRRLAMALHLAGFRDNVIDTWGRSSRDPGRFIDKMKPILERYHKSRLDTRSIDQLKKDIFEGTDRKVELLKKLNKLEAVPARAGVRCSMDMGILRGYMQGLRFDPETPDVIKTSVNKIMKQPLDEEALGKIHDDVKKSIKSLKNPKRRQMLQFLVLQPLQVVLGKITPMDIDTVKRNEYKNTLKDIERDESIKRNFSENLMLETKTKGTPPSQMKPQTQKIISNILRKIAHLLMSSLH